jgi:hypothetical protein
MVSLPLLIVSLEVVSLAGGVVSLAGVVSFPSVVFYSKVSKSVEFNRLVPFEVRLLSDSVLFSIVALLISFIVPLVEVELIPSIIR